MSTIYTHDGRFHADELFAIATIRGAHPGRSFEVVRTRDPAVLARAGSAPGAADAVVDVGGLYEVNRGVWRLDHHQWTRAAHPEKRPCGLPRASAGLAWLQLGRDYLRAGCQAGRDLPDDDVRAAWDAVDLTLIATVDAADLGIALVADPTGMFADVVPLSLSALLSAYNDHDGAVDGFTVALRLAETLLAATARRAVARLAALVPVRAAIAAWKADPAADRRVLALDEHGPWIELVTGDPECASLLYTVFRDERGDTSTWMVQCVPTASGSFGQRRPLPLPWASLRDGELAAASGVADAVFCHPGRFLAGARSREGALALAAKALA